LQHYQQHVVEEEHFTLMSIKILFLCNVGDFTESTVANEASTWHGQLLRSMYTHRSCMDSHTI